MVWMIGIDEAGYGPNLGPLVVAATAWHVAFVPSARTIAPPVDLYARLADIVSPKPADGRLAIADSKTLYKPGAGLRLLERGVLAALEAVGGDAMGAMGGDAMARWQPFWDATQADPEGYRYGLPWYAEYDCPLPIDAEMEDVRHAMEVLHDGCKDANVRLAAVCARAVFPREFNELTEHYGTKGAALSHVSIGLLREVIDRLSEFCVGDSTWPSTQTGSIHVTCDKHGGRNRYAALLQHHFPDQWIATVHESRPASRYQWGPPEARVEVCFRTKGEAELPTALASMTAKYHRELAMRAFNAFWSEKVPGLRPTAGYPVDAKRFKADIAAKQQTLGIDDRDLWRNR